MLPFIKLLFLVNLKKWLCKCNVRRKMAFVKFSKEKIGDLYPIENSHELFHFNGW